MKKIVLAFMVIVLVGSLVACAGQSGDAKNKTSEKHTAKNVKDTKKSDDAKKTKTNNLSENNTEKSTDEELKEESLDLEEIYWQEDEYVSSDDTPGENRGSDDQEPISPEPTPAPEPSPEPEPVPEPESWTVGIAGAYGGSSDPGCGSRTATGELIDDSSMGVSIPMAWPNYHTYFGRMVEIKYGDTIVLAKINDCGYMGGGSMSLDLQPGVFKAFGFDSCNAWGIREVSYHIL